MIIMIIIIIRMTTWPHFPSFLLSDTSSSVNPAEPAPKKKSRQSSQALRKKIRMMMRVLNDQILSSPRAERARAATVSEVGQDFLLRRRVTLTETGVTRKRKVEKWIQRCQIDRLREGYKRAIDEIWGPIAKTDFWAKI